MKQKRVMLLGGNYFQMTATKAAKRLGYYVISVDYLPNNPAHKFADEYHNISTTNKDEVLELAKKLRIDGIVSYASDVSAPTAAFVAEKMGLPTNPYESVNILTRKDLLRPFMEKHGFKTPKGKSFSDYDSTLEYFKNIKKPVIIKPVDSSGSKGVTKAFTEESLQKAYYEAMKYSFSKTIVVEEFITRKGFQISGDAFLVDGELRFVGLMDNHFDRNEYGFVPIGSSYPSVLPSFLKKKYISEVQRLMNLLHMKMGALNLEGAVDSLTGELYVLEVGPRNGGSLIPDAIKIATGVDLAEYTIKASVGDDCSELHQVDTDKCVSSYNIHSMNDGCFNGVTINPLIQEDILLFDLFVKKGDFVNKYRNSSMSIGSSLIKHNSSSEMIQRMENMDQYIVVNTISGKE